MVSRHDWWPAAVRCAVILLVGLVVSDQPACAQQARYELGRRVRAFERLWAGTPDPEVRHRASPALQEAVKSYFALNLPAAARAIDGAGRALSPGAERKPASDWAASLVFEPASRLQDQTAGVLDFRVGAFYDTGTEAPGQAALEVNLRRVSSQGVGQLVLAGRELPLAGLPQRGVLELGGLEAGDYELQLRFLVGGEVLATQSQLISLVDRLADRLERAREVVAAWPLTPRTTERESARFLLDQLSKLAEGRTLELDVPAARRLAEMEALIAGGQGGGSILSASHPGDYWLSLVSPEGARATPCRLLVPAGVEGSPRPLVVALHGAGGSENLFFESYGDGAIVGLCRERGWFVVAPRSPLGSAPLEDIVDELARIYPIDRERVFVVGHSMGAAQAVSAAVKSPSRYRALAALGGGGRVIAADCLDRLPVFVGVGEDDFALASATALADAFREAGTRVVVLRKYPGIEHLAIVQEALPDVFCFFDAID